jgi:hypothetical protein
MKKLWSIVAMVVLAIPLLFGNAALAFDDLQGEPNGHKIAELKKHGIVSGIGERLFHPREKMTYAQAVQMLVKGFRLNIDNLKFIKEPKASDYFTRVPDDAWYAKAFIIAHLNGLPVPKDVDPQAKITKEEYADLLFHAIKTKGDFAIIEIWINIADEADVSKDKMNSIQALLILKIAALDDKQRFHPKDAIRRGEAAEMLYNALEFVKKHVKPNPPADGEVTLTIDKVNDEVNKVTLSWGEKPNSCYRIAIANIEFVSESEAIVYYALSYPTEEMMCSQVITHPQAVTYVASQYQVQVRPTNERDGITHGGNHGVTRPGRPAGYGVPGNTGEGFTGDSGLVDPDQSVSSAPIAQ